MKPDPSLISFVNSTNNLNDDDPDFEVTFYNESLTQILSKIDLKELNEFLEKPVFVNPDLA